MNEVTTLVDWIGLLAVFLCFHLLFIGNEHNFELLAIQIGIVVLMWRKKFEPKEES